MRLIHKILLGYFLIVTVIGIFSTLILFYNIEKNSKNIHAYREREITSFARVIDAFLPNKESLKDIDKIQKLFVSITHKLPHIKRLTLHVQDEKTLKYSHVVSTVISIIGTPSYQEDIDAINNNETTILYEDSEDGDHYLDITYPILDTDLKPIAALGIAVSLEESDTILQKSIDKMKKDAIKGVIIALILSIILALILAFVISKIIIAPLEKLKKATASASVYNLGEKIDISSNDEIGELAQEFNSMTLELQSIYSSMEDKIKHKTNELENQFFTDTLTNFQNRFALFKDIESLRTFHVAILDIASFKDINDVYGIDIGNKVLKEVAKKYNYYLIDTGLKLYRLSSDEMVILNPNSMSEDEFSNLIETIVKKIEHETFYFSSGDIEINISIHAGISHEMEHALEKANLALIKAKTMRADCTIFNNKQYQDDEHGKNINTISKIKHAINNFGIVAHYQAIVDRNHDIIKYEALVRMKDGDKTLSPFFFLDISKKTKYYHEITKTMIFLALDEFKDRDESISINLCAEDIISTRTQDFIREQLTLFKEPSRITFELVESEDINKLPELKEFISYIKGTGAKIAIDDFGTGYSNFAYLMDMEPDYIKIDGSLIKNIDTDRRSYEIVQTIIKFAHGLNIKVIAEFIHSQDVLKVCEVLGVDEFQGYYFSEPAKLN